MEGYPTCPFQPMPNPPIFLSFEVTFITTYSNNIDMGLFRRNSDNDPVMETARLLKFSLKSEGTHMIKDIDETEYHVINALRQNEICVLARRCRDGMGSLEFYSDGIDYHDVVDDENFLDLHWYLMGEAVPFMHHPYILGETENGVRMLFFVNKIFIDESEALSATFALNELLATFSDMEVLRKALANYAKRD